MLKTMKSDTFATETAMPNQSAGTPIQTKTIEHRQSNSMQKNPEPTEAFLAELAENSQKLESATPEEIIAWAVESHHPGLTMATAFGPEGCVILSLLAKINSDVPVFNIDTGYQFQETLDTRDRIAEKIRHRSSARQQRCFC